MKIGMIPSPTALRQRRNGSLEQAVRLAREPRPAVTGHAGLRPAERQVMG